MVVSTQEPTLGPCPLWIPELYKTQAPFIFSANYKILTKQCVSQVSNEHLQ